MKQPKKYKGLAILYVALLLIISAHALTTYYCANDIFCIELDVQLPDHEIDVLNNYEGVTAQTDGDTTQLTINMTYYEENGLTTEAIENYAEQLERNSQNNLARITIRPDGQSAPLCMRDYITTQTYGVYIVNGQLYTLADDVRCPS